MNLSEPQLRTYSDEQRANIRSLTARHFALHAAAIADVEPDELDADERQHVVLNASAAMIHDVVALMPGDATGPAERFNDKLNVLAMSLGGLLGSEVNSDGWADALGDLVELAMGYAFMREEADIEAARLRTLLAMARAGRP